MKLDDLDLIEADKIMNQPRKEFGGYSVTDLEEIGTAKINHIKEDTFVVKSLRKMNTDKKMGMTDLKA